MFEVAKDVYCEKEASDTADFFQGGVAEVMITKQVTFRTKV